MFRYIVVALLVAAVSAGELSEDERNVLKSVWGPLRADPQGNGVKLFGGFLKAHHEIKAQFPKFKDVSDADLDNNADFRAHALKIFEIVDNAIVKKDFDRLKELSSFHKTIGQTNKDYFLAFRNYFLDHLNLNADQLTVWNKAADNMMGYLFSAF